MPLIKPGDSKFLHTGGGSIKGRTPLKEGYKFQRGRLNDEGVPSSAREGGGSQMNKESNVQVGDLLQFVKLAWGGCHTVHLFN